MLRILTLSYAAAWALSAVAAPAAAADLDQVLVAPELPPIKPVEVGSGWYLRGDVGYSVDIRGGADSFRGVGGGTVRFDDGEIKSDWSESVGIGYHFNDWLRSDVTFEYSDGKFDGSLGGPCVAANPVGTCDAHQDFSAWGFMANGYVDLGTVAGFTPYVGGGVGIMRLGWKDLELSCVGSAACQPVPSHDGENDWRFAWQLSAGMAYAITKNLKLDVGYRYFDIADAGMFDFADADRAFGVSGLQGKDKGLTKQEVRVGLRYDIW